MTHPPARRPIRVAVVGTPRSGNTWVRGLIADSYEVPQLAVHDLAEADTAGLPEGCVIQVHRRWDADFADRLRHHGFRVVTVARHPLDVLVSVLHFAAFDPDTDRWLGGLGGDESGIVGAMPRSRAFVEYATGSRAAALLAVTADWWGRPGVIAARYEEFVADPAGALARLTEALSAPAAADPASVAAALSLDRRRRTSVNAHFWQGRPGLWRALLPEAEAREIASAHPAAFAALRYDCDPDPGLDPAAAERNWVALTGPDYRAAALRAVQGYGAELENYRRDAEAALAAANARAHATLHDVVGRYEAELAAARRQAAEAEGALAPYRGLQGLAVRAAWAVQRVRDRAPGPAAALKRLLARRRTPAVGAGNACG